MKRVIMIGVLAMILATPAFADLEYRLDPCYSRDWNHNTQHTITIQVRSESGPVTLYGVEVWVQYYEFDSGTYVDQLRLDSVNNLVPTSMLEASASKSDDDGEANYSQYRPWGGTGTGLVVDSDWVDLGELVFTVIGYNYHFVMECSYLFAYDTALQPIDGSDLKCGSGLYPGEYFADPTGVELVSFTATGHTSLVSVEWITATEPDNAGFHVLRAQAETGEYQRITGTLIPAEGDETQGAEYEIEDSDVDRGNTYWYKLEDISIYGVSTFHGPVDVTLEDEPFFSCGMVEGGSPGFALLFLALGMAILKGRKMTKTKKGYRKPEVKTTSGDEVIRLVGPAQTCSPSPTACQTAD